MRKLSPTLKHIFFILLSVSTLLKGQSFKKQWTLIPKGKVYIGSKPIDGCPKHIERYVNYEHKENCLELKSFYIAQQEVSNREYREFINSLKSKGLSTKEYEASNMTLEWNEGSSLVSINNLNRYDNHPVVAITYESAKAYCLWLQKKIQPMFKQHITVKLPNPNEWKRATFGDKHLFCTLPWEGNNTIDKKGRYLLNYRPISDRRTIYNIDPCLTKLAFDNRSDGHAGTAPVDRGYQLNEFGLRHAMGNVSEMLEEKGKAIGGNWFSTSSEIYVDRIITFSEPSLLVGFRPVIVFE